MKKLVVFLAILLLLQSVTLPTLAADGKVTYSGNAGEFVFTPGSEGSLTDLFPNFKDVMPGDTLTQRITVKNDADKNVKVKIYIRSLGADEASREFLSQLGLMVQNSKENEMGYMFAAAASETAQLTDWVCLGTLYSGGEVNLDVTLAVPVELGNEFQNKVGILTWEFKVEELPVDPDDPKPPQTRDDSNIHWYFIAMFVSLTAILILLLWRKKKEENHG